MEWVETTAKSLEAAKERALDQLGVAADEAEFEVLEEPRAGLFGRTRGEARVRARVKPTAARPKQERRNRGRKGRDGAKKSRSKDARSEQPSDADEVEADEPRESSRQASGQQGSDRSSGSRSSQRSQSRSKQQKEQQVSRDDSGFNGDRPSVSPQEVGDAAVAFMSGLARAFGADAETTVEIDGTELEVRVTGSELGLMVGHGGRTLIAVQDLARVASQRRLGDHDTRLKIDVAGYREKRRVALEKFATAVANEVVSTGEAKALEPMQSADRKIVHDALAAVDGVTSRSEGDDPVRRVVISPA